jgi:hypothetical protein
LAQAKQRRGGTGKNSWHVSVPETTLPVVGQSFLGQDRNPSDFAPHNRPANNVSTIHDDLAVSPQPEELNGRQCSERLADRKCFRYFAVSGEC